MLEETSSGQMSSSILSQSITPSVGHGVGRTGSSARPHDGGSQNLPLSMTSLPGSASLKSSSHQLSTLKPNYALTSVVETGPPWLYKDADLDGVPLVDARTFPGTNSSITTGLSPLYPGLPHTEENGHDALATDPVADLLGESYNNLFSAELSTTLAMTVSSAVELDRIQIEQIRRKMQRITGFSNLRLENRVDPSLIAGFVVRYGNDDGHVIDLSVKGQLAQLSARIESSENRRVEVEQRWSFLS